VPKQPASLSKQPATVPQQPATVPTQPATVTVSIQEKENDPTHNGVEQSAPGTPLNIISMFGTLDSPLTPLLDEDPMITDLPKRRRLSEEIIEAAQDFETRTLRPDMTPAFPTAQVPSRETATTETIQNEFRHVRKDASFHAVQLKESLKEVTEQVIGLRKDVQKLETQKQRSDFQDRLEIAGHGAQLLDILGNRHPHGNGFQPSCQTCQKGNDMLISLISLTNPRLMDPFRPSFL
jgi:hypothetical protein